MNVSLTPEYSLCKDLVTVGFTPRIATLPMLDFDINTTNMTDAYHNADCLVVLVVAKSVQMESTALDLDSYSTSPQAQFLNPG